MIANGLYRRRYQKNKDKENARKKMAGARTCKPKKYYAENLCGGDKAEPFGDLC